MYIAPALVLGILVQAFEAAPTPPFKNEGSIHDHGKPGTVAKGARYPHILKWEFPVPLGCTLVDGSGVHRKGQDFYSNDILRALQNQANVNSCNGILQDGKEQCTLILQPVVQKVDEKDVVSWRSLHIDYTLKHIPATKSHPAGVAIKYESGYTFNVRSAF